MTAPADLFKEHNVFLAHCSSFAPMVGSSFTKKFGPLERLSFAAGCQRELSCSTIGPQDSFQGRNFTGTIGLILLPPTFDAITHATPIDGGTEAPDNDGEPRKLTGSNLVTMAVLRAAIKERPADEYNEICVSSYEVIGVFLCPPVEFSSRQTVSSAEIVKALPNQRFFFFHEGALHEVAYAADKSNFTDKRRKFSCGEINLQTRIS